MPRRFTKPQLRAIEWLPSDGSWRIKPGSTSQALYSLQFFHHVLVEYQVGQFGVRGAFCVRWRLTPAGVQCKAEIKP
jgi:hypothetical protein